MPSQTAGGLPYPLQTDPVRDGAAAIQALADKLDLRGHAMLLQQTYQQFITAGDARAVWTFPKAFAVPPAVAISCGYPSGDVNGRFLVAAAFPEATRVVFAVRDVAVPAGGSWYAGAVLVSIVAVGPSAV